MHVQYL